MVNELEDDDNEASPNDVVVDDDNVESKGSKDDPDNDWEVADEGDDSRSLANSYTYFSYL